MVATLDGHFGRGGGSGERAPARVQDPTPVAASLAAGTVSLRPMTDRPPLLLPITLLTGFLGAGKTTLLRHVLSVVDPRTLCIVENEFGAANIDGAVLETLGPGLVRRMTGCICCVVRGDLVSTLLPLAQVCREQGITQIVLETTGMAAPGELISTLRGSPELRLDFRVSAVVTVVDAENIAVDLRNSPTAQEQVAFADRLIVNKVDLLRDAEERREIRELLIETNPLAEVLECTRGEVPASFLLDAAPLSLRPRRSKGATRLSGRADHEFAAVTIIEDGVFDLRRLLGFLGRTARVLGDDLVRVKGLVQTARSGRVLVDGVRSRFTTCPVVTADFGASSVWVLIGRGLSEDEWREGLNDCRVRR